MILHRAGIEVVKEKTKDFFELQLSNTELEQKLLEFYTSTIA